MTAIASRTGVSLHGHTLHSQESLHFLYRLAARPGPVRMAVRRLEQCFLVLHGRQLDFSRAWWTPPLAPHDAWRIEAGQLALLGLKPIVSLTDHDCIDAPLTLRVLDECREIPISVEWTLPWHGTEIHLGLHNLPASGAREWMSRLAAFTKAPEQGRPEDLLSAIAAIPGTLVVLNHPLWDELEVGETAHLEAVQRLLRSCRASIHAIEWNGLRPLSENRRVAQLARAWAKPVVSGGDRHGVEPNVVLNVTDASDFAEFAAEVREGHSHLLLTDRYFDSNGLRMLLIIEDVLREHPGHGRGWVHWSDRVFYRCDDGAIRSFHQLFGDKVPGLVGAIASVLSLAGRRTVRQAFRLAFSRGGELIPS